MTFRVYFDRGGAPNSRYGYFVEETLETSVLQIEGITNNEAEYHAIINALTIAKKYQF